MTSRCKARSTEAHATSPGDENTRQSLPHDLTKLTLAQLEWCVVYHRAMPLSEIRRRQELTDQQIGLAWRQRNDFALANLVRRTKPRPAGGRAERQSARQCRATPFATLVLYARIRAATHVHGSGHRRYRAVYRPARRFANRPVSA